MPSCQLKINNLRLWTHLGYSDEEKANSQAIQIDIEINFAHTFAAATQDDLTQTICYAQLVEKIQSMITQHQPFTLLEYLTGAVYACVYHELLNKNFAHAQLLVTVTKLSPPIPHLHGGASFRCEGIIKPGEPDDLYQHWF